MKGDLRRWLRGAVIGVAAGFLALAATHLPLAETYENRSFDVRARLFADPTQASRDVVAVVIDQKSLDVIGRPKSEGGTIGWGWPWPRDFYAYVVDYLVYSGARAVVFDLLFSEPSVYMHRLEDVEDDTALAKATSRRPVVHAVMLTQESVARADRTWKANFRQTARTARRVDGITGEPFNKATLPIPEILEATSALGSITFTPDDDGVLRTVWPTMRYAPLGSSDMVEVWSLATAAALVAGRDLDLKVEHGRAELRVDGRPIPLDDDGRMVLRFHGGEEVYRQYPFVNVLQSARRKEAGEPIRDARPADFRDKIVIIGATAAGLLDLRATPMGGVMPGFLIQATALDNLVQGNPIWRVTPATRAAIVFALAVAAGALAMIRATRLGILAVSAIAILYIAVTAWAYGARGIWLDVVAPVAAVAFAWAGSTGYAYVTEGRERRFLRDAFSRYLAPDVVEALVAQPGRLSLGGETRELTVMFADVAGFTTLAEGRAPAEVVSLMNECFEQLTGVIQRHGGTVDKFIGDAVMAFWNAPVAQADHAARAMRAARELLDAVDRVNASWADRKLPRLGMRVGLATGPATVGNVGSQTKFNYTVMGDTVNLASRLEGAAKVYGTLSLISDGVVNAAGSGGIPVRELDRLRVKGKGEAVTVYEVLREHGNDFAHAEAMRGYAKALETYRSGAFVEAAEQFDAVLTLVPDDGPSLEMKERCLHYMAAPPPPGWRGDHVLTSK